MSELSPFDDQLAGLIGALLPTSRRRLVAEIAKQLHAAQHNLSDKKKRRMAQHIRPKMPAI